VTACCAGATGVGSLELDGNGPVAKGHGEMSQSGSFTLVGPVADPATVANVFVGVFHVNGV